MQKQENPGRKIEAIIVRPQRIFGPLPSSGMTETAAAPDRFIKRV
jgi:hypothetical protein